MKGKKGLLLFLALLLPIFVFLFLKMFGNNEFAVKPLYQHELPVIPNDCSVSISVPYQVPDSVVKQINFANDSLVLLWFTETTKDTKRISEKILKKYETLNQVMLAPSNQKNKHWMKCIFFLKGTYNIILMNNKGTIRGQYAATDREEIDRLFIELDIIFKKY